MVNITDEACAITKRFFFALDVLIVQKKLKSLNAFATTYKLNYWNLCTLRKEPDRRVLKVEYITYVVRDFNVSPDYILLGIGTIMRENFLLYG